MDVRFLTPAGAGFALLAFAPLAVLVLRERRARQVRVALGLAQPGLRLLVPPAAALLVAVGLLALAATQPVVETTRTVRERTDAEVFVVADVSRSMLASVQPGSPTRLERLRAEAERLREALPEVPVGILSLTDRLLPHLFPTVDRGVFRSTLATSIGIERPPPALFFSTRATQLGALAAVPERRFFSPTAKKRLLVVYTDGESQAIDVGLQRAFALKPAVHTVLVHVWDGRERIYETGVAERAYAPDASSRAMVDHVADLVGGRAFEEREADGIVRTAVELLGTGPTRERVLDGERRALMPVAALAVLLPLGFLLLRRNV